MYETGSVALREERRFKGVNIRVLRIIFGFKQSGVTRGWRKGY
jgi:hypothetical protein